MQSRQGLLIDTARHVQAFLDENAAVIGPTIAGSRANLDSAVAELNAMGATQTGGRIKTRGATARQKALRRSLRANFMKPLADIAKLKLGNVPEIGAFTMPSAQLGVTQLVAAAHGMADAADLHEPVFAAVGLPAEFTNQLRAAADAVTASLDGRQLHRGITTSATAGITDQEKQVRALFKIINALVVPRLGTNVVLLQKWKATKAITHKHVVPTIPPLAAPPATPASGGTTTPAAGAPAPAANSTPAASTTPAGTPAPATPPAVATSPSPAGGATSAPAAAIPATP